MKRLVRWLSARRGPDGEQGSVLIITLVFLTVVGLVTGALLSQSFAQHKASRAFADRRNGIFAADAGLEHAIAGVGMRGSPTVFGGDCVSVPVTFHGYNGYDVRVTCTRSTADTINLGSTATSIETGRRIVARATVTRLANGTIEIIDWDTLAGASSPSP